MKEFETKARDIFRYLCPYHACGIVNSTDGRTDPKSAVRMRYAGFAKAQMLIIEELKLITARELIAEIKAAKKSRNKLHVKYVEQALIQEKYKETVIRKLADSIAWQLIDGRSDLVHWSYSFEEPPAIDESNLTSVLEEVNKLNQADPLSFALISDITSFVQVGDILRRDTSGIIKVIEVKEGEANMQAMDIVENELMNESDELSLARLKRVYGESLTEQARRIRRQMTKGDRVTQIINTGEGEDPKTGTPVIVREPKSAPFSYRGELAGCLMQLDKESWAYTVIEDCLLIGCYKGLMKRAGKSLLSSLARTFFHENFVTVGLAHGLRDPMCEPIFLKAFREDDIFDIIFDRTRVFLVLNLDWMIQNFRERGAKANWLSRKETTKLRQRSKSKDEHPFVFDGKAIVVENESWDMFLGDGSLRRIFFDNFLPSWVVSTVLESLNP